MKKVLITGIGGFTGGYCVDCLRSLDDTVGIHGISRRRTNSYCTRKKSTYYRAGWILARGTAPFKRI